MRSGPHLSGMAYSISSCSMILLNRVVLSSYGFNAAIALMLYQGVAIGLNTEKAGKVEIAVAFKFGWSAMRKTERGGKVIKFRKGYDSHFLTMPRPGLVGPKPLGPNGNDPVQARPRFSVDSAHGQPYL
ncbi:GDP-mannose transporter GONST2 [Acorus calamus]|uniref:GDP-mannose transporter GONST2 n=1 Tax=Acorus calamus TaxID=4465 RepID=A0AAV9FKG5_ACOCL|nr:GDP-mannose transporter GONST2 [Acorus calamus]